MSILDLGKTATFFMVVVLAPLALEAAKQKVGGVTWSYKIQSGYYDEDSGEYIFFGDGYYEEYGAIVTGASPAKGVLRIPAELGGFPVLGIDEEAFAENQYITRVVFPEGLEWIGPWAFEECHNIVDVTFPESLRRIGRDAFCACRKLGDVYIPAGVEGGIAFPFCQAVNIVVSEKNPYFRSDDGVVYSKDGETLVCYPPGRTGEWSVPSCVTAIGDEAFAGALISAVNIHSGVTYISTSAPFVETRKLKRITVDEENPNYKDVDGVLFSKDETLLIAYPAGKKDVVAYTVPPSVTQLASDVFSGCVFKSIILPSTLKSLPYEMCEACNSLTSLIVGSGVTDVKMNAFYYIPKLPTLTLPASVETIEDWAFEESERLKTIYVPKSASSGRWSYAECPAKVVKYATAPLVKFDLNYEDAPEYPYNRNVAKGQPVGVLPTPVREDFYFGGWWTSATGGSKITSATKISKNVTFYARWMKRITLVSIQGKGSVSGAGNHAVGSKVTLVATPAKGYVFWYWDFGFVPYCDDSDYLWRNYRQPKVSFTMPAESFPIWAVFAKTSADVAPKISVSGSLPLYAEEEDEVDIHVDSISYASLGHNKTLPSGMVLKRVGESDSDWRLCVADAAKLPRGGIRVVKLTAKNRSGRSASRSIKVVLPNITTAVDKGVLEGLNTSACDPYELAAGIKFTWSELGINPASGWKISSITGIPGLKWDAKSQKMTGIPSKGGIYTATFTVTKGKISYTATATFVIKSLPSAVVGTFNGYCSPPNWYGEFADNTSYALWRNSRKVTVTVASSGKVTAKIGSVSLAGTGLTLDDDGNYRIYINSAKKYSGYQYINRIDATINPSADYTEDALTGHFGYGRVTPMTGALNDDKVFARKNATATSADAKEIAAKYAKLGKQSFVVLKAPSDRGYVYDLACPNCIAGADTMKKTAFLKIEKDGKATLSGTIAGTKVSGTTYLSYEYDEYDGEELEVVARFFVGKFVIEIRGDTEYFYSNGSLFGRVWKK